MESFTPEMRKDDLKNLFPKGFAPKEWPVISWMGDHDKSDKNSVFEIYMPDGNKFRYSWGEMIPFETNSGSPSGSETVVKCNSGQSA